MSGVIDHPVRAFRLRADDAVELAPLSLPDMLDRAAERSPDAPLIDFFGRVFSYGEVADLARRVATGLAQLGIRPGDRVGLHLPNVPYYVAAYYGALRLGAVVVNLPPCSPVEVLRRQIDESGTRLIFTLAATDYLPRARDLLIGSSLEMLVVGSLAGCLSGSRAFFHRLFGRGALPMPPADGRITPFDDLVGNDGSVPRIGVDPERDIALIQYPCDGDDSGSGAAAFTHQALTANARQMRFLGWRRGEAERALCVLPLSEMAGQACVLNRIVAGGGEMVMLAVFQPSELAAAIRRCRANSLPLTPAMLRALLGCPGLNRADLASLDVCIAVGAPVPQALCEQLWEWSDAGLVEAYARPEAGIVSWRPADGRGSATAIGRLLPATHVTLVDRENPEREPAPGEPAEIAVHGPQVMRGYWRNAGAPPFIERDGLRWLLTGDIASIDMDGQVYVMDRLRDTISVTGFRAYPSRIEAILRRHVAVDGAVVVGVPDDFAGELPKAFVTLAEGATASASDLRAWLNARVGKHEQLVEVEIRDALPEARPGGPDRRALIRQEAARRSVSGSGAA